jgi:hypothetical protein
MVYCLDINDRVQTAKADNRIVFTSNEIVSMLLASKQYFMHPFTLRGRETNESFIRLIWQLFLIGNSYKEPLEILKKYHKVLI